MSAPESTITENGTITSGIVLTSASYTNPVTIASTANVVLGSSVYPSPFYAISAATAWTVQNDGTIDATGNGRADDAGNPLGGGGIALTNGGVVVNAASGRIDALYYAIKISGAAGTILNQGLIDRGGVLLTDGGSVDNAAGATISGNAGIYVQGGHDTVTNEGSILSSGVTGIAVLDSGTNAVVVNGATGFVNVGAYGIGVSLYGAGTLVNQGTIEGGTKYSSEGVVLTPGDVLDNNGFIYGNSGVMGTSGNAGTSLIQQVVNNAAGAVIKGIGAAADFSYGVVLTNLGTLSATGDGIYLGANATVINAGVLSGGDDAVKAVTGNLLFEVAQGSAITGNVVAYAAPGVVTNNILDLAASSGTAALGTSFQNFNTIEIAAGTAWLLEGDSAAVAAMQTIVGFGGGDTLDLTGVTFAGATYSYIALGLDGPSYGYLGITNAAGNSSYNVYFSGLGGNPNFVLTDDGHGGTDITLPGGVTCFCRGTLIRTAYGEVPVEDLVIGDLVATVSGGMQPVKWIGKRAYAGRMIAKNHLALPVTIKAGAIAPARPARDLHVSPGHGILVNGILVPAWRLVNGVSVTQAAAVEQVEYFHVELPRHEVILAENCAVESFLEQEEHGLRALFQNAAEFYALYPDAAPEQAALPRADHGWQLQMGYRLVAARAGVEAPAVVQGALQGAVDLAGPYVVSGWAQDCAAPEEPVALDILRNGVRIAHVLADIYRPDLRAAGLGSGCHGFAFACAVDEAGEIEVRRADDGAVLALPGARPAQAA